METDKCSDHAYATVVKAKLAEDTKEILQKKVDEVRLNDLNDAAEHDPLCLNDMNENGRDVNSIETESEEMETNLEHKASEEKEVIDQRKAINPDGKVEVEADSGTVLNIKSVFVEKCDDDNKVNSAEQVENKHSTDNPSEPGEKSINEDSVNSMTTSEEDLKPQDSEKMSVNDCEESDNSEEVIEMESQIKSDAGNGIVISLTRKRSTEAVKRKSDLLKSPPSKYRKYIVMSTRRSPRISAVNGNSNYESEDNADENVANKDIGTGISIGDLEEDDEKDEIMQSSNEENSMRSRRSASHSDSAAETKCVIKTDPDKNVTTTPKVKTPPGRKHLFFKGKKASPAQTKPLSTEELAKYRAPFDHGWRRELVYRGTYDSATKTQADTYYFPPGKAPKLRSMVQISEWLLSHDTTLTTDNFTFMRRAIGVDGELVRNASQSRGRASMEAALKKRSNKQNKNELIHDDNDGQFDKPEIVIERDSDDFIGQIMTVMNQEEKSKDDAKSDISGPKLVECKKEKEEKLEILSASPHGNVVTYVKKKTLPKSTARKSTTQKTFKKSLSQTGVENLCSLNCPGLQGMPPMLHCNVCMCLFHQECVNFFGSNGEFVCLRCKDMCSPDNNNETTVLQASNPTMLKHLKHPEASLSGNPTVFRTFPNGDTVQESCVMKMLASKSTSPVVLTQCINNGQTIPAKSVSPYKTVPFSPSPPVSASMSYPVLLTPDPSFVITSSAPAFPVSIAAISSSLSSSKSSVPDSVSARMSEYSEIRPLIKQEPVDFSYDESQRDKIKASSEALDNLKNVLSSRIGHSNSEKYKMNLNSEKSKVDTNAKHHSNKSSSSVSKSFINSTNNLPLFGNIFNQQSQFNALPQNMGQSRLNFGTGPPPQMQYGPNSGFRLVPVGPPIPLGGLQVPLPMVPSPSLIRMTNSPTLTTTTNSKSHRPQSSEPKKIIPKASTIVVSSQDDASASGPLVVNAKAVTPLNGQMLTLPPPVVKKLTLDRPLALKINNKQITVPPSGFFHSDDGLKVFLPPNTFPTAEENIGNVSVIDSKVTVEESSEKASEATNEKSSNSEKDSMKSNKPTEEGADNKCVNKLDIRKNKFYNKCCLMQRLYGVYDCMVQIFKYLSLQDLLKIGRVCKTWRKIVQLPDLWADVQFMNLKVNDWDKALKYLCRRNVQSISLVGVTHFEDPNRTWHQLVSSIHELSSLKKISLCHIPSAVLQTVTSKLPHLESLCAEKITDFIDDTMWEVPSKLDIGNFCTLTELRELKLSGPGGLTIPSFNFGCSIADLGKLSNLRTLHLTSLKNLKGSDFNFISSLPNLEYLALGDCEQWTKETYSHLKQLTSLRFLCLECGGEISDTGLGEVLSSLTKLETLELWKYAFTKSFVDLTCHMKQLKHLCVYPVSELNVVPGVVNTNTLNAVRKITNLKTLKWVFQEDNSSTIILSDSENKDNNDQWIPFQAMGVTNEDKDTPTEYISVKQLKEKFLEKPLPNTQVNVCCSAHARGHS